MPRAHWANIQTGTTVSFEITNNDNVPIAVVTEFDSPDDSLDKTWVGDNTGTSPGLVRGVSTLFSVITFHGEGTILYKGLLSTGNTFEKPISGNKGDLQLVRIIMEVV